MTEGFDLQKIRMDLNELKESLKTLEPGEIATVAMIDRGAYAEMQDAVSGGSKMATGIFKDLAAELKAEDEDLTVVGRVDIDVALTQEDIDASLEQMSAPYHIIFLECLYLGTTEIKSFLYTLKENNLLASSKVVLLDLPQLEYMMLKDSLTDEFNL